LLQPATTLRLYGTAAGPGVKRAAGSAGLPTAVTPASDGTKGSRRFPSPRGLLPLPRKTSWKRFGAVCVLHHSGAQSISDSLGLAIFVLRAVLTAVSLCLLAVSMFLCTFLFAASCLGASGAISWGKKICEINVEKYVEISLTYCRPPQQQHHL